MNDGRSLWTRFITSRSAILKISSLARVDQLDILFHPIHHPKSLWTRIGNSHNIWAIFVDHEQANSALDALTMHGYLSGVHPALQNDLLPYATLQKVDIAQWRAQQLQQVAYLSTFEESKSPEFTYESLDDDGTPVPPHSLPAPATSWTPRPDAAIFHPTSSTGGIHSRDGLRDIQSNVRTNSIPVVDSARDASRDPSLLSPLHDKKMSSDGAMSNLSENGVNVPSTSSTLPTTAAQTTGSSSDHDARDDDHLLITIDPSGDPLNSTVILAPASHRSLHFGILDDSSPTPTPPPTSPLVEMSEMQTRTRLSAPSPFVLGSPAPYLTSNLRRDHPSSTPSTGSVGRTGTASINATISIHSLKPTRPSDGAGFRLFSSTSSGAGDQSLGLEGDDQGRRRAVAAEHNHDHTDHNHGAGTKATDVPRAEMGANHQHSNAPDSPLRADASSLPSGEYVQPTDLAGQRDSPFSFYRLEEGACRLFPGDDDSGENTQISKEHDRPISIGAHLDHSRSHPLSREPTLAAPAMLSMGMGIQKGRDLAPINTDLVYNYTTALDSPCPELPQPAHAEDPLVQVVDSRPRADDHQRSTPVVFHQQPQPHAFPSRTYPTQKQSEFSSTDLKQPTFSPFDMTRLVTPLSSTSFASSTSNPSLTAPLSSTFSSTSLISPLSTTFGKTTDRHVPPHLRIESMDSSFINEDPEDGVGYRSFGAIGQALPRFAHHHPYHQPQQQHFSSSTPSNGRAIGMDDAALQALGGIEELAAIQQAVKAHQSNATRATNPMIDQTKSLKSSSFGQAGTTQLLIPTTLGNSPPTPMVHAPVVINHKQPLSKHAIASQGMRGGYASPTSPAFAVRSPPIPGQNVYLAHQQYQQQQQQQNHHQRHFATGTSYAALPGTTSSTHYAGISPLRTPTPAYPSPNAHAPKPPSLLTPSGRTFALGGRVRNIADEANPILMFWPDNEALPLACQIRPPAAIMMALGGIHGPPPPILNTGNKGPIDAQPGDWVCGKCDYLNWRRRRVCANCFPHAEGNTEGTRHSTVEVQERVALLASVLLQQQQQVQVQQQQLQAQQHASAALLVSNLGGFNNVQTNGAATNGLGGGASNGFGMNSVAHHAAFTSQRDTFGGYNGHAATPAMRSTPHTMNLPPRLVGSMDPLMPRFSNASTSSLPSMSSSLTPAPSYVTDAHAQSNAQNLQHPHLRLRTEFEVAPGSGRPSPPSTRSSISAGSSSSLSLAGGDHTTPSPLPLLPSFLHEVVGAASDAESQSQSSSSLRGSPSPPSSASVSVSSFHMMPSSRSSEVVYQPSPRTAALAGHGDIARVRTVGSMDLMGGGGGWKEASPTSNARIGHGYASELGRRPSQSSIWSLGFPPEK